MTTHHVTAIASDPQRTLDFYVGMLGLRLTRSITKMKRLARRTRRTRRGKRVGGKTIGL